MVLVLVAAGLFVYLRLEDDLNESVTAGLETRAGAVASAGSASAGAAGEGEEGFAQLVAADGTVVDSAGGVRGGALSAAELQQAAGGDELLVERRVAGIEGTARVLARADGGGEQVVVVGQSLDDRDETLAGLVASFAVGGPIAVVLGAQRTLQPAALITGRQPGECAARGWRRPRTGARAERLLQASEHLVQRLAETADLVLRGRQRQPPPPLPGRPASPAGASPRPGARPARRASSRSRMRAGPRPARRSERTLTSPRVSRRGRRANADDQDERASPTVTGRASIRAVPSIPGSSRSRHRRVTRGPPRLGRGSSAARARPGSVDPAPSRGEDLDEAVLASVSRPRRPTAMPVPDRSMTRRDVVRAPAVDGLVRSSPSAAGRRTAPRLRARAASPGRRPR